MLSLIFGLLFLWKSTFELSILSSQPPKVISIKDIYTFRNYPPHVVSKVFSHREISPNPYQTRILASGCLSSRNFVLTSWDQIPYVVRLSFCWILHLLSFKPPKFQSLSLLVLILQDDSFWLQNTIHSHKYHLSLQITKRCIRMYQNIS